VSAVYSIRSEGLDRLAAARLDSPPRSRERNPGVWKVRRPLLWVMPWILLLGIATAALGQTGQLKVEIREPAEGLVLKSWKSSIEVEGGASIFGRANSLDLFLVLDTSESLRSTDPENFRTAGAIGLVENISAKSNIQIGVVDFDGKAHLVAPLTRNRAAVSAALRGLDQEGMTDLAAGIRTALEGFEGGARVGSSRVMLLFTDGKSSARKARKAMEEARQKGVAIHTLLLGNDRKGASILREIAEGTGGTFLPVTDPSKLPDAFLNLRTTGVENVTLRVNGSPPIPTRLVGGTFTGRVPLQMGENRIVAKATSLDGTTREDAVRVIVTGSLSVAIDTPVDGTLFTERKSETAVEGSVSRFENRSPEFATSHPNRGVQSVVLSVNGSSPFATKLEGGRFRGRVLLQEGENRIVATATSSDGRTAQDAVDVTVRSPGCAELQVMARRDGKPALSISDRSVEIVFDASNSMWAKLGGESKISIAKAILSDALDWLPRDVMLALRVYGHQHRRELRNCRDSELLVPPGTGNRQRIREAIAAFQPRGQTPLGYSLEQIAGDFGDIAGERAVVLVTDGIESCGGNPVGAARSLRKNDRIPVHVIGFGLESEGDADPASLRAIADASGGKFLTARSAEELREALSVTVGTTFRVLRRGIPVAAGTLGADELIRLPADEYAVRIDSEPALEVSASLSSETNLTLVLERRQGTVSLRVRRRPSDHFACEDPLHAARPRGLPAAIE
jgi:Mg-chelatase subunit ChlD